MHGDNSHGLMHGDNSHGDVAYVDTVGSGGQHAGGKMEEPASILIFAHEYRVGTT